MVVIDKVKVAHDIYEEVRSKENISVDMIQQIIANADKSEDIINELEHKNTVVQKIRNTICSMLDTYNCQYKSDFKPNDVYGRES